MASSGRIGDTRKNGIIHPVWKVAAEIDAYGGQKCDSNMCSNGDEAINGMGHTSQRTWFENVVSKIIVDDVLLYGCIAEQLLDYFRTVLDVLKRHRATL